MSKPYLPNAATTVEDALHEQPGAVAVFMKYRTGCVGCRLARFCTVADVAIIYDLGLQSFLYDLRRQSTTLSVDRRADWPGKETPWN